MSELTDKLRERLKPNFGPWWMIRGGMIHPWWKRRQYSKIRDAAMSLPREAWIESSERLAPLHELFLEAVEALEKKLCMCEVIDDVCEGCKVLSKLRAEVDK